MKRLITLAVIVVILLISGGLTAQLIANSNSPVPILTQSENPEASVTQIEGWQADQFFLLIGFIVFNLVGIAVTLAVIFWFLDRGVKTSRAEAAKAELATTEDSGK